MGNAGGVQITILGPLTVDGRPVRGERLAAVVRELVEARGRSVSTATLVDAIWDGAPPENAAGAIQALVSRVRRLGLPVTAVPGGYRMLASEVEIDAVEAKALAERARAALAGGDPAATRNWSDQARALFPDVPELDDPQTTRLLADIAGLRAEAALAGAGTFEEADLRRLVARTPPDEPAAALLVRVLAAQGRDAEALQIVETLRSELADRYGTDPSPVVAEVHLALLRGELAATVESPRPAPAFNGLPAGWRRPRTPLVGREREVTAVGKALADAGLVTLVAPGGAGKTSLAAEVARRVAALGEPVRVVELASSRSPDDVRSAMVAGLSGADPARPDRGHERRRRGPEDLLAAAAQDLEGVVVLDNCEHVLAAAADVVADLLAAASPRLAVLATSRAPLSLVGEVVYRLPALPDSEALHLLETRARAGGAALNSDTDRLLELCRRLDNLPLALELAAARLRHMPVDDVLAGLTDRFGLLDDALRGLPERHASLWAMVDWSHELLAPADQALLRRLAVVPDAFTAELAASVAGAVGDTGAREVRRGLATLVDQSLLSLQETDDGPPRYRMLETVREYGEVRLDTGGTGAATAGREAAMAGLVAWARVEAVACASEFIGPRQLAAFARCTPEQDNLTEALRWSIRHEDEAAAVDIAAALFHLWTVRGLHLEVISWAKELFYADDAAARRRSAMVGGRRSGRPLPHADRLAWTCLLTGVNGGIANSLRLAVFGRRVLRVLLAERAGDVSPRARSLVAPLEVLTTGMLDDSLRVADEMIENPDPYVQGYGYFLRSTVAEVHGVPLTVADEAERAYRRFEAAGDHWGMGMSAQGIGEQVGSRGREAADEWLRRGELHLSLIGAVQDVGAIRVRLDVRLALSGDLAAAERLRDPSITEGMQLAQARLGLAHLACRQGQYAEAVTYAEEVSAIAGGPEVPWPQQRVLIRTAVAILYLRVFDEGGTRARGDRLHFDRAFTLLGLVEEEQFSARDSPEVGSWALGGAALAAHRGDDRLARELWSVGVRLGANVGYLFPQGHGERLTAALGEEDDREPVPIGSGDSALVAGVARIRALMAQLLG